MTAPSRSVPPAPPADGLPLDPLLAGGFAAAAPALPARIGQRYQVVGQLGRGGTATVYRVRDTSLGQELALKQLILHGGERERTTRALFEREFCLLAQLSHPSVIEVYDYGVERQQPFYTMELLDGGDLSAQAPMDARVACGLMVQLCSSLSLLHSRKLVHRDISPRNVRCTLGGRAKLIDFGALMPMGPCPQGVGTPGFVAPEVVHRMLIDARTDLFSLGATLYFALTGRKPFAARSLQELNEALRHAPLAPSQLAKDIPAALDALVLSLLQIDAARRPQTAFEVMQRLAVIAGISSEEPERIAQSYLSTPALVGRDAELRCFRQQLKHMQTSTGGCLLFEGVAGSGRSRVLSVCELEAKLAGARVVRIDARALAGAAFAALRAVVEQLRVQAPATSSDIPALTDEQSVQALDAWLLETCQRQPLVLVVDDVERSDGASLGWLASLAHKAQTARLLIVAGTQPASSSPVSLALEVLRSHALVQALAALSFEQTESLLKTIFFDAPHVSLLSHRVFRVAAGNPRESMALVQYLLERKLVRYSNGKWSLPAQLALADLPADAEEVVRARIAALPETARELVTTQALDFELPFTLEHYAFLISEATQQDVRRAVAALVQHAIVVKNGDAHTLTHLGVRACLTADLSAAERVRRHRSLGELSAHAARAPVYEVHHRLMCGETARALDRLSVLLDATPVLTALVGAGLGQGVLIALLERARGASLESGRPAREACELTRRLVEASAATDEMLYARYASAWLERLELDSGWRDYQHTPAELPHAERLQRALEAASQRYQATPEGERVYDIQEAIKQLASFVSISVAIAARNRDTRLQAELPARLEPFAGLSPLIDALVQLAVASAEMNGSAHYERARTRMLAVYSRLQQVLATDNPYISILQHAVAGALATLEVSLGYPTAQDWIAIAERDPIHRLGALYLRRVLCVYEGDRAGAELHRTQAELFAIQTEGRAVFGARLRLELAANTQTADLAGTRDVADRIAQLAHKAPGWTALRHVALGAYEHLRGNRAAARAEFEAAVSVADPARIDPPPDLDAWLLATAGSCSVLRELGQPDQAFALASNAANLCEQRGLSGAEPVLRELCIAQAALGTASDAIARMERLIHAHAQLQPYVLALDYEACTRIAIAQRDPDAATRCFALAVANGAGLAVRRRLSEEALALGLELDVAAERVESQPAGAATTADRAAWLSRFAGLAGRQERAGCALALCAEVVHCRAGHLYYRDAGRLLRVASLGSAPDLALDYFAERYLDSQLENAAMSTIFTDIHDSHRTSVGMFTNPSGASYGLLVFGPQPERYSGIVALSGSRNEIGTEELVTLTAAIARYLVSVGDVPAA